MKKTKIIFVVLTCLLFLSASSMLLAQDEKKPADKKGIEGDWKIVSERDGRKMSNKLSISKRADGSLKIMWNDDAQDDEIFGVKFEDNKLSFTRTVYMGDWDIDIDFEATLKDDKLTGKLSTERGDSTLTGTRIIPKPDAVGIWLITSGSGDRQRTNELVITVDEKKQLKGKWVSQRGESEISNIKFEKGKLAFDRVRRFEDREFKTTFEGTIKGHELTGTFKSERGDRPVSGKRKGAELIGRWDLVSKTDRGDWESSLLVDKDLAAEYRMGFGNVDVNDLKLEDGKVTFNVTFGFGERGFEVDFELKIDGDKITGQSTSDMGTSEISGRKFVPKPAKEEAKKD